MLKCKVCDSELEETADRFLLGWMYIDEMKHYVCPKCGRLYFKTNWIIEACGEDVAKENVIWLVYSMVHRFGEDAFLDNVEDNEIVKNNPLQS